MHRRQYNFVRIQYKIVTYIYAECELEMVKYIAYVKNDS